MLYCVTGATGLLGNNLIRNLLKSGHQVRVGIRDSSDILPLQGLNLQIRKGELTSSGFAKELVSGCDGLIHTAGFIWFGKSNRELSMRTNVDASCNLAAQCAENRIRMVFVSSTDALAAGTRKQPANETCVNPAKGDTSYVTSKRAAESALLKMMETLNLDIVIANPCLFFGPYDWKPSSGKMILALTETWMPLALRGGISVGDARNVAAGVIAAMQEGVTGQRYILAGENITYCALWRKLAALAGRKGPLLRMPPRFQTVVGFGSDIISTFKGSESQVNSAALKLGANWNYYDSSKAISELGYDPGCLTTTINDAWHWLIENGYCGNKKN